MKKDYKPKKYYPDIHKINYELLKKNAKQVILFDLDNTIADNRDRHANEKTIKLFKKIHDLGFKTYILSNALPNRVKRFSKELNCEGYCFSCKPFKWKYNKILKKHHKDSVVAIGDQIYTDVLGANNNGIESILVDRISKFESIFTIPNRIKEKLIIEKKRIIVRGEYYE